MTTRLDEEMQFDELLHSFKKVLAGLPDEAAENMRVHLKQHNSRVINEALSQTT